MQQQFYNYKRQPVDLVQHCFEQRAIHGQDLTVFIGTDSISVGGKIHYFIVVAFRYGKNGVHFIYAKEKVPTYRFENGKPDIDTKLRREGHMTMDLAKFLVDSNIFTKDQIIVEFDYNDAIPTVSTRLIPEMKGLATWFGYQSLTKYGEYVLTQNLEEVTDQIAVKAANHLCQGVS